ncbi:MAG: hypothetical protein IPN11_02665 [Opitutaceae bacterium]|nr:hypothetical protein [Opitutaceae bacterium]
MRADIIPLPSSCPRPACAMTAEIAYRVMKLYEAAIALGFRAEMHAATGAHRHSLLCRRAVSRLRRLAFSCLLANLSKDELPHFTDQLYRGQSPAAPLWQLCL